MKVLAFLLMQVLRIATTIPWLVIAVFAIVSILGFAARSRINISTSIVSGFGQPGSIAALSSENAQLFGEQDALIIALQFPQRAGDRAVQFMTELAESIRSFQNIRQVRYRLADPQDAAERNDRQKRYLLGMDEDERSKFRLAASPEGLGACLSRNINRLYLAYDPDVQDSLLKDPLEIDRLAVLSMRKKTGGFGLAESNLLLSSQDGKFYLIQVTPDFPGTERVKRDALVQELQNHLAVTVPGLLSEIPLMPAKSGKDVQWHLSGKLMFHYESARIFYREAGTVVLVSIGLVLALLVVCYGRLSAGLILLIPILAGVGPNYGLTYLLYDEVNPIVLAASGVLFGLGTDYGVHLWGRFSHEFDRGVPVSEALAIVYRETGPAVFLGALTNILAFLVLCLSNQPAMVQFGYVGASGLLLTLVSTLFLFPALATKLAFRGGRYFPRMRLRVGGLSRLFQWRPATLVVLSAVLCALGVLFSFRISYEPDLYKVFLARDMESSDVSRTISDRFRANFAYSAALSFDAADFQEGLVVQRQLDRVLDGLLLGPKSELASYASISHLAAPDSVCRENLRLIEDVVGGWPKLREGFFEELEHAPLSVSAAAIVTDSFEMLGERLSELRKDGRKACTVDLSDHELGQYVAKVNSSNRFLTRIRYSDRIFDPEALAGADSHISAAVSTLPLKVSISGIRQTMEEVLSTLVSELLRLAGYVFVAVLLFFFILFRHPVLVLLSVLPMLGAFCFTLGFMGAVRMGLPVSVVAVAPLIFGLAMDNGVHVVTGCLHESGGNVETTMDRVTRPILFTSLTNVMGFAAMLTSSHYSLEFLGWAMLVGMAAALGFTFTTLPSIILLLERRSSRGTAGTTNRQS